MADIASGVAQLQKIAIGSLWPGAAFVGAYLSCALLGNFLTLAPELGAFLWPPSGLLLAVLLRDQRARYVSWLCLAFAADFTASVLFFHFPPWLAICIATGNCLEAAFGAKFLRLWAGGTFHLNDARSALALAVIGGAGTTLFSTLVGGTAIAAYTSQSLVASWRLWWSGDAIGVLVVAPIALTVRVDHWKLTLEKWRSSAFEYAALCLLLLGLSHMAFYYPYPVAFTTLPIVIWTALRHGFATSSLAVGVMVIMAVTYASTGHGPFIGAWSPGTSQFLMQGFAIVIALTGLVMAGLSAQVRAAQQRIEKAYEQAELLVCERTSLLRTSEAQLQEAVRKLTEADRAKDHFMFTLAHELRNPLSTLENGLTILETAPPADSARTARDMMSRQLAQAVFLIDELSDLARIKSGKMVLAKDRLELGAVVQVACEGVRHRMEQKRQAFTVDLPAEPIWVIGDKVRLAQAVVNLLSNANRYTPTGGAVTVKVSIDGTNASVCVTDNGRGIPHENLPYIFNMYDQAGRGDASGLGIGLALVKQIVELHGGGISVQSAVGQGSTFTLRLPLADRITQTGPHQLADAA